MRVTEWLTAVRCKPVNWNGQLWTRAEVKHDGHRVAFIKGADGSTIAMGRKPHVDLYPALPLSLRALFHKMPPGSIIDGELCCPGNASEVTSYYRTEDLFWRPFAVARWGGVDTREESFDVRDTIIREIGLSPPTVAVMHNSRVDWGPKLIAMAKTMGVEGFVLKISQWRGWYKVKPTQTVDVIVFRCLWGESEFRDMLGSMEVGFFGEGEPLCAVGSGFSKQQRQNSAYMGMMGRVMEVRYDKIDNQGGLRFPRFVRWRDDKEPNECTRDQLS